MADSENNIIFGAEFEGQGIAKGVDDLLTNLDKVVEAQVAVKTSLKETNKALADNRKEFEKLSKQAPLSADAIEKQKKKLEELNAEYDDLTGQLTDLTIVQKKVNEVGKQYTKTQNEHIRNTEKVGKAVHKLTSINELAADGIKKAGNYAKDAAFSFVSGFAGGIIATVIPSLVDLASELFNTGKGLTELEKRQKIVSEIQTKAVDGYSAEVSKLEIFRGKLTDLNVPQSDRIKLAKEYNKTAEEGNKIAISEIDNINLLNAAIDRQIEKIKERAIARAFENILAEKAQKLFEKQIELQEKLPINQQAVDAINKSVQNVIAAGASRNKIDLLKSKIDPEELFALVDLPEDKLKELAKKNDRISLLLDETTRKQLKALRDRLTLVQGFNDQNLTNEQRQLLKDVDKFQEDFDRTLRTGLGLISTTDLLPQGKPQKEIENVFEQKLRELKAKLAATATTVFESEPLIRDKFKAQLDKEFGDIAKLIKDKKLTQDQGDILNGLLKQINDIDLNKGLTEFRKKVAEAIKKINDSLNTLILEDNAKRIANIRDEFDRERAQLEESYAATVDAIKKRQTDLIKQINDETTKGLLSPELAKRKKFIASLVFGDLLDQAEQAKMNAQAELAFKQFQRTLELAKLPFEEAVLGDNELTTKLIREQAGLFLEGKISYEKYQKNLTKIIQDESNRRRKIQLDEAEESLRLIDKQLSGTLDDKKREQLEKQRDVLRGQISVLKREIATGAAGEANDAEKKRIDLILQYVNAVQNLAASVIGFWQQVNQAEATALDRSIALQNKRVENARDLAEKGNAEYLELEQKRLDELTRKREENARKQLAINNALTASQAIVAAISAIAQAVQSGSPIAAIAAVAAVIGAIGAAYQFVNSLQPQEASFFEGTEFVSGKGVPAGKDKVRARLHVGERVVTAKENQDYWGTLSAIHNRTIPPEALNSFVEAYPNFPVPLVDFDRLSSATEGKIGADSLELLGRVDGLNDTMKQVVVGLNELGINVNLDEHGFEASIAKARKRRILRGRS